MNRSRLMISLGLCAVLVACSTAKVAQKEAKELIEAGAMAKVGVHLFLHKTRFWPEYQRIVADQMNGGQR